MSDTISMTELELAMRKLANQVKLDTIEACAKIAFDAEDDRASADSPYDNGSGSCGYSKACFDIERAIRALATRTPQGGWLPPGKQELRHLWVCTGCGSRESIEQIRGEHPGAIACCPERKMAPPISPADRKGEK